MHERYFDNAATTPVDPRVIEAMLPWMYESPGNAHSIHHYGLKAHDAVEKARAQVAAMIGAEDPSQITFTSGATEANNWVLHSMAPFFSVSPFEHASLRETALWKRVPIVDSLSGEYSSVPREYFAHMWVNNETGTIFPYGQAALVDATQGLGKLSFDLGETHFVSGSAHKFFGPKGIGFLYQRTPGTLTPLIYGGGQEAANRGGTLNVPAIIGLGMAAEIAADELHGRQDHASRLNQLLLSELRSGDFIINGGDHRSPYILSLSFAGIEGETLLIELDQAGFCCSAGAACSSQNTEPSPVLKAFGVPDEYIRGTIRISFSHHNTEESTYQLATKIREIVERLRRM